MEKSYPQILKQIYDAPVSLYIRGNKEILNGKNYTYHKLYSSIPKKTKGLGEKNGEKNRALSNVWTDISPIVPWSKERVKHPSQKPLALMERCVLLWTNENDTVLDFTMGSGTTGVACKKLNRNFIGIERDKEYFEIARKRIDDTVI